MTAISARIVGLALVVALGPGPGAASEPPPLEVITPAAAASNTLRDHIHVLGRTRPDARVRVDGQEVPVYSTGIFVRDNVPLAPGANRIRVEASSPDGAGAAVDLDIERSAPPPPPAPWPTDRVTIDASSILPQAVLRVAPGEPVDVQLRGSAGMQSQARLPGQAWQRLVEDPQQPGSYRAQLHFPPGLALADLEPRPVELRLSAPRGVKVKGKRVASATSTGSVGRWAAQTVRLVIAGPEGADLLHGLHQVRLGGPNLAELPPGTVLRITGQQGDHYRVRLAPDTQAWVPTSVVAPAPPLTKLPAPVFTNVSVSGNAAGDTVTIPFPAPAPFAVRSVSDDQGRIVLEADLYGTHLAATWISQLASARLVREVTLEQPADGRVRVRIVPVDRRIWGWRVEQTERALRITLRAPPVIDVQAASPLAGLTIALEPGHGGPGNLGAVGATKVPEKDINRWTVETLKAELESAGARVVVVREGDDNPGLRERAQRVTASNAALFVSVHANAADTTRGYLRVAGTSSFFKHAASRELSGAIHRRMLEATALPDFGQVGNFNYAPIRLVTWMPAVLVEQAFVSNPAEEARLLDPAFRATMARAVRTGIEDFLRGR